LRRATTVPPNMQAARRFALFVIHAAHLATEAAYAFSYFSKGH
jgi:hypothetical protein